MRRLAVLWVLGALRAASPVRRRWFIIVTTQRTGSTWLSEELAVHPCIECGKELFLDVKPWKELDAPLDGVVPFQFYWSNVTLKAAMANLVDEAAAPLNLTVTYDHFRAKCARDYYHAACGFKWMASQHVVEHWRAWLADFCRAHGVSLVFLTRANLLRVYASKVAKRMRDTDHGTSMNPVKNRTAGAPLELPTGWPLVKALAAVERTYAELRAMRDNATRAGIETLGVTYEMLQADRSRGLNAIANFTLGSPPHAHRAVCDRFAFTDAVVDGAQGKQTRLHAEPMSTFVANWDAVVATLVGTRFERFLGGDGSRVPRSWDADMGAWTDWGRQWTARPGPRP